LIALRHDWYLSKGLFKGFFVVVETMKINEDLMEIWPNEVCDRNVCRSWRILRRTEYPLLSLVLATPEWFLL